MNRDERDHGHADKPTVLVHRLDPTQFEALVKLLHKLTDSSATSERAFTAILNSLEVIKGKIDHMSQEMDDLVAEVASTKGVVASAVVAIAGLRQAVIDAGTDKAKLKELTDSLKSTETDLANAIAAPGGP